MSFHPSEILRIQPLQFADKLLGLIVYEELSVAYLFKYAAFCARSVELEGHPVPLQFSKSV
jgi:hypothetical protein